MNKKPQTPAEIMRFQNGGICELLRRIASDLEAVKQIAAEASDALTDYENALEYIVAHGSGPTRSEASAALRKHKIKK